MKTRGTRKSVRLWSRVRSGRRGGAVVEMAVVTPLLLSMMFGMIEFGYVFMMQQSLTNAARDACRMATLPGTTTDEIKTRVAEAMEPTGLDIAPNMVTVEPATEQNPVVTVRVSVPYEDVTLLGVLPSSLFPGTFKAVEGGGGGGGIEGKMIGSAASMRIEGSL